MHEQAAAVDVPQEIVAKARAFGRTLDNTGDIGHDERHALIHIDDAEIRVQRGEVVVCDLRAGIGRDGQQRGLADIREADKADIRQQLQLQHDLVLLAGQAGLGKARHLTGRRGKMLVAPATAAALAEDKVRIVGHILDDLVRCGIAHDRTARDLNDKVLAALAGAARALPVLTGCRSIFALVAEVHQRGEVVVHAQDDIAALAAVAAVRATCGHIFLAVEGNGTIAAVTGLHRHLDFINKHRGPPSGLCGLLP